MKKIRLISLMLTIVMCVSLALTSCGSLNVKDIEKDPTGQVIESSSSTAKEVVKSVTPLDAFRAACEKGSINVSLDMGESGSVSVTAYADKEANKGAFYADLYDGDQTVGAKLWADSDKIVASVPALSENAVGLDVKTAKEDIKTSAILELLGTSYDEIKEDLEKIDTEKLTDAKKLGEDFAKFTDDCVKVIKDEFNASKVLVEKAKIDIGTDKPVKGYTVSYSFDGEDVIRITEKVANWFTDEANRPDSVKGLIAFLEKQGKELPTKEDVDEMLNEMRENIKKDTVDFGLKFSINAKTAKVMRIDASLNVLGEDGGKYEAKIILGEDAVTSPKYTAEIKQIKEDKTPSVTVTVDRIDNSEKFERVIKIAVNDPDAENSGDISAIFTADRKADTFTLTAEYPKTVYSFGKEGFGTTETTEKITASGDLRYSETEFDMTVKNITVKTGEKDPETTDISLRITAKPGDEIPAAPEYKSVLKMAKEELEVLGLEVEANLDDEKNPFGAIKALIGSKFTDHGDDDGDDDRKKDWDIDWDDDWKEDWGKEWDKESRDTCEFDWETVDWETYEWETVDWETFDWGELIPDEPVDNENMEL